MNFGRHTLATWTAMGFILFGIHNLWGQRPDFTNFDPRSSTPQTNTLSDTIVTKEFKYRYYLIDDLAKQYDDYDTSISRMHLVEKYYEKPFIGGNLGSENSSLYQPLYEYPNRVGIEAGYMRYQPLLRNRYTRAIVDVNRPLANIGFGKGYNINSSRFTVGFYKRFNRNILLNFNYANISDDGWTGIAPNEFKALSIKLFQEDSRGKRKSYVVFDRGKVGVTQSRGQVDGISEFSDVEYTDVFVEMGNVLVLRDSLPQDDSPVLNSKITIRDRDYTFYDQGLTDSERSYFRSTTTEDTLSHLSHLSSVSFFNSFAASLGSNRLTAGVELGLHNNNQTVQKDQYEELIFSFELENVLPRALGWFVEGEMGLLDAAGDVRVKPGLTYQLSRSTISGSIQYSKLNPDLKYKRGYFNSDLLWDNDFGGTSQILLSLEINKPIAGFSAGISASQLTDWVTLSTAAIPVQQGEAASILSIRAEKTFNWGPIRMNHRAFAQKINHDALLRPEFQYSGHFELDLPFFKEKMDLVGGLDTYYISSYTIPDYHPVTGEFYSDGSQSKSGHIVLINPFINLKIDRFFGFVKMTNAASRVNTRDHFTTLNYPIYDFRISVGIRWDLLD